MQAWHPTTTTYSSHCSTFHTIFKLKIGENTYIQRNTNPVHCSVILLLLVLYFPTGSLDLSKQHPIPNSQHHILCSQPSIASAHYNTLLQFNTRISCSKFHTHCSTHFSTFTTICIPSFLNGNPQFFSSPALSSMFPMSTSTLPKSVLLAWHYIILLHPVFTNMSLH